MTAAIYARVSTKEQSEAEQIPAIKKGFDLSDDVIVFREEVSAWSIDKEEKRHSLKLLISEIKTGSLSKLYIWDIDRLYRNRKKMREFMNLCNFYDVSVYSLNQKWLNDFQELKEKLPENFKFYIEHMYNLLLDVYSQTAEDESAKKSERVKLKIVKDKNGTTRSTSGKKWGRRSLPPRITEEVLQYHQQGKSIRWISANVFKIDKNNNKKNVSIGTIHKIVKGD